MDWQTSIAIGIVGLTLALLVLRLVRPGKRRGCGHHCHCGRK